MDVQAFVALVAGAARLKGVPDTEIWGVIMTQWWNRVSLVFAGAYIVHRWQMSLSLLVRQHVGTATPEVNRYGDFAFGFDRET